MSALLLCLLAQVQGGVVEGTVRVRDARPAEAVVYLTSLDAPAPAPGPAPERRLIDQRDLRFTPKVVVVTPGSSVEFLNSDPILHNVFSPDGPGPGFDLGTYRQDERRERTFDHEGSQVILCRIHPEMLAYVVVAPSTLRALTGPEGGFRIVGVPPGRWRVHVWHPRAAPFTLDVTTTEAGSSLLTLILEPRRRHGRASP